MIAGAKSVLWVRLDRPGNDACRFADTGEDLLIEGNTTEAEGLFLHYRVRAGSDGVTKRARVGDSPMMTFERQDDGRWLMNGTEVPAVAGCFDFDLGITPATNTLALRRLALKVGEVGETVAAWLDPSDWTLKPLKQTYTRVSEHEYDYASTTGYGGRFEVDDDLVIRRYPGWWERQE
jgi:hypothetical protein